MRGIVSQHAVALLCLVWIDLHTGPSHYGRGEKIFNSSDPAELECAMCTWGVDVRPTAAAGSVPSVVKGDLVGTAYELLLGVEKACVMSRFSMFVLLAVLRALRTDH